MVGTEGGNVNKHMDGWRFDPGPNWGCDRSRQKKRGTLISKVPRNDSNPLYELVVQLAVSDEVKVRIGNVLVRAVGIVP